MNVASYEMSQELYELSGWLPRYPYYWTVFGTLVNDPNWYVTIREQPDVLPAYPLGFILSELPSKLSDGQLQLRPAPTRYWFCGYAVLGDPYADHEAGANTPEDAACKLAIELFKRGVVEREAAA